MVRGSYLARRIQSSRLLLGNVMLAVLITAALGAALATFSARALPQAVQTQIISSPDRSITISGSSNAAQAAAYSKVIRTSFGPAMGGLPYQTDSGLWSDLLDIDIPHGSRTTPLIQAAALSRIREHAALVAGRWPGPPRPGQPIGAALPVLAARRLHLVPGAILRTRDSTTNAALPLRLTGVYRPAATAAPYWGVDLMPPSGISIQPPFISYGPAVVSPAAFGSRGLGVSQASWVIAPTVAGLTTAGQAGLAGLAARLSRATAFLQNSDSLGGMQVSTGLPALLGGLATSLVIARSLLVIGALELALLSAAALGLAARLLADQREEESALLSARGATRWQLARPTLAEIMSLGAVAAAAGLYAGIRLAGALISAAQPGSAAVAAQIPAAAWSSALAVLVFCTLVMIWPAVRPMPPGAARVRRGRQATLAGVARHGADLALLGLALLGVQELRTYSVVAHPAAGRIGIDPVVAVAPVLALAAVTLIPLRLLPFLAGRIERATARGRHLAGALASWQISRRPLRQSGPLLLVVLATAAFTLALAQYQSSRQSAADQAAFAVGADLRPHRSQPGPGSHAGAIGRAPGVRAAMPVASQGTAAGGELLALDPRAAAATVLLRSDLSPYPLAQLWRWITWSRPLTGLAIPGRPAGLAILASLTAGSAASRPGPASVTAWIQDADGTGYQVPAGGLAADGRSHPLIVRLSATRRAVYPLRLLGLSVSYLLPPHEPASAARRARPATLAISGFAVQSAAGRPYGRPYAIGVVLASWHAAISAPGDSTGGLLDGSPPVLAGSLQSGRRQVLSFHPGYGPSATALQLAKESGGGFTGQLTLAAGPPSGVIPAIATRAFVRASGVQPGGIVPVSAQGVTIPVQIVAELTAFPTVTQSGGAVIVDQAPVQAILASRSAVPLPVQQWWLATSRRSVPPALAGAAVTSRVTRAAALLDDPLSAAPRQAALAIGIAAALLAAIGFSLSVAASVRTRRAESALLAALGVARRAQAGQLCLEQLMLSLPAALAGLLAGAGLAWLLVPAVVLTPEATTPVPPVRLEIPLGWAVLVAAAVAALPVLAAAASVIRRPDPAAELRAAESA